MQHDCWYAPFVRPWNQKEEMLICLPSLGLLHRRVWPSKPPPSNIFWPKYFSGIKEPCYHLGIVEVYDTVETYLESGPVILATDC